MVEGDAVDPRGMPGVLANILALDDISEYDILIAAASDELGVVLADVEGVDVVVVDVAVVLDEQVPRRVVEAHPAVLRSCHAVLAVAVELYGVYGARVALHQLRELGRNTV